MLKVLVATNKTKGYRNNDFNWCNDGEFVVAGNVCDSDCGNPDNSCGCARSMSGLDSRKGTTQAVVASVNMTKTEFRQVIMDAEKKTWGDCFAPTQAKNLAEDAMAFAANLNDGDIVEWRMGYAVRPKDTTVPAKQES
jgi:hypothetical protein